MDHFRFAAYDHGVRTQIEAALQSFLESCGKAELHASLNYLLAEVIGNADKANLKRAYFSLADLDITSEKDYALGMPGFKEAVADRRQDIIDLIQSEQAWVQVRFQRTADDLILAVQNTCPLHPVEKERIQTRLKLARKFNSIQDALEEGLDQTEGGGFGLIISVLTLRKIGLDETALRFDTSPQGTRVSVVVPLNLINKKESEVIAEAVLNQIQHIPQFPQNVLQILNSLIDPTKTFDDISAVIRKDPALIADILKTANSSMYMLPKKIDSIEGAVRVIGVSALRQLVMLTVSQNLLTNVFKLEVVKKQMEHAAEVAFYASELTKFLKDAETGKNIFLCAMLHDFGKIIIESIQPKLAADIEALCRQKGLNGFLTESLTNGYNHSLIGAELAKKWNFPDSIVESIRYHHLPLEASEAQHRYVWVTYLANFVSHYARGESTIDQLSDPVLKGLKLTDPVALEKAFRTMIEAFKNKKAQPA